MDGGFMKHEMQSQATKQALVDSLKQLLDEKVVFENYGHGDRGKLWV